MCMVTLWHLGGRAIVGDKDLDRKALLGEPIWPGLRVLALVRMGGLFGRQP